MSAPAPEEDKPLDNHTNSSYVLPGMYDVRKRLLEQRIKKDVILEMLAKAAHPENWEWLREAAESLPN